MCPHLQKFLAENAVEEWSALRKQIVNYLSCPGLFVGLRIVDGVLVLQAPQVHAPDALHKVQSVAMRMPDLVDPAFVVDTDGVHDQRVSLIFANGVPHPGARKTCGMLSPVHVDAPHPMIVIEEEEHLVRELAKLENAPIIDQQVCGTLRHTAGEVGIQVLPSKVDWLPSLPDSLVFLLGPGLHLGFLRLVPRGLPGYSQ